MLMVIYGEAGHDETDEVLNSRDILQANPSSATDSVPLFERWRVTRNAGRESDLDPVLCVRNKVGLFGEYIRCRLPALMIANGLRTSAEVIPPVSALSAVESSFIALPCL